MASTFEIVNELTKTFVRNCEAFNEMVDFYHRDGKIKSDDKNAIINAISDADICINAIHESSITYKKRIDASSIQVQLLKNAQVECGKAAWALQCALNDVLDIH